MNSGSPTYASREAKCWLMAGWVIIRVLAASNIGTKRIAQIKGCDVQGRSECRSLFGSVQHMKLQTGDGAEGRDPQEEYRD